MPGQASRSRDGTAGGRFGIQRLLAETAQDLPDPARPRSWFAFRGRMNRKAFWLFYLFSILVVSIASALLDILSGLFPAASEILLPILLFGVVMSSMAALCGAMVRRVRDAGLPVWIVPVSLSGLLIAVATWLLEVTLYQLNSAQGTLEAWISTRPPLTEIAGVIAVILSAVLFAGLVRRSRPGTE